MKKVVTHRRSPLERALWYAGPFKVTSSAVGFQVTPGWREVGPRECSPPRERDADGDCVKCGTPHIAGVFTRVALAEMIEELLNKTAKPPRKRGSV